jgi:hypothetical protein
MGSIVHLSSNALANTILNIFCTFSDECAEQNTSGAFIALANLRALITQQRPKEENDMLLEGVIVTQLSIHGHR